MPPNWPTATVEHQPTPASAPARALRAVPGEYTITDLPIHVPVQPDESSNGLLRRAAYRYGITPGQLLNLAGPTIRHSTTNAVHKRLLTTDNGVADDIGLCSSELAELQRTSSLDTVVGNYLRLYRNTRYEAPNWSRYCPHCLAADPTVWRRDWHNPLTLLCTEHRLILLDTCPSCGQRPYSSTAWLGQHDAPAWTCPSRRPARRGRFGRSARTVRPFCEQDLRQAHTPAATIAQEQAQRLLLDLATHFDHTGSACGVTACNEVIAHAFVELLDATSDPWQPDTPAGQVAAHLRFVLSVLRPTRPPYRRPSRRRCPISDPR